mgnify:CR=1 FL=1
MFIMWNYKSALCTKKNTSKLKPRIYLPSYVNKNVLMFEHEIAIKFKQNKKRKAICYYYLRSLYKKKKKKAKRKRGRKKRSISTIKNVYTRNYSLDWIRGYTVSIPHARMCREPIRKLYRVRYYRFIENR